MPATHSSSLPFIAQADDKAGKQIEEAEKEDAEDAEFYIDGFGKGEGHAHLSYLSCNTLSFIVDKLSARALHTESSPSTPPHPLLQARSASGRRRRSGTPCPPPTA